MPCGYAPVGCIPLSVDFVYGLAMPVAYDYRSLRFSVVICFQRTNY